MTKCCEVRHEGTTDSVQRADGAPARHDAGAAMSIALLRHWLGTAAPSPHDTELRRAVRDALVEFDAVAAEVTSLRHECIATGDAADAAVKVANAIKAQRDAMLERADSIERIAGKTADFDPPGREYTTGDALGLRRDR